MSMERKYHCKICGKSFAQVWTLQNHEKQNNCNSKSIKISRKRSR